MQEAKTTKKITFSTIWILPIIALIIGGWLLFKAYQNKGIMITLQINDASGIKVEKTKVYYKGLPVGKVKSMNITKDLKHILLNIEMIKRAKGKLVEDTKFWVVKPEISLTKVAGLDSLISGSYISVLPGKSKKQTNFFIASSRENNVAALSKGEVFNLSSKNTLGHKAGEPVVYKKIRVGEVISSTLYDNDKINVKVVIYQKYKHLINSSTLFFDASGIKLNANLNRIKVDVASFESLIAGGIEFVTENKAPPVSENHVFTLYTSKQEALNTKNIQIEFKIPIEYGVALGTKIKFKSLTIGQVTDIEISKNIKFFNAKAVINPKAKEILTSNSYFWIVSPKLSLNGVENLDTIVKGEYINVIPAKGKKQFNFFLYNKPPEKYLKKGGITLVLKSKKLGSIKKKTPILHKQFKVGEVISTKLSPKDDNVYIKFHIYNKYKHLVHPNTIFWNASGINMKAKIFNGISLKTESMASIVNGGIAFDTPKTNTKFKPLKRNHIFKLYETYNEKLFKNNKNDLKIKLTTKTLDSIKVGSPILYNKFKVGEVLSASLNPDNKIITIDILIYDKYKDLVNSSTKFWNVSGVTFEGGIFSTVKVKTQSIESIVIGGIAFDTPIPNAEKIKNEISFKLYKEKDETWFNKYKNNLFITLVTDSLDSIKKGNPILYRQFKVGEVVGTELSLTGQNILINITIDSKYKHLVTSDTKFWNTSGIKISGGLLSKMNVNIGSMETIIKGGIAFATPDKNKKTKLTKNGDNFVLYKKVNPEWLKWNPSITINFDEKD